jgi:hypothetical protein
MFAGTLVKQSSSLEGLRSTVSDIFGLAGASIAQKLLPQVKAVYSWIIKNEDKINEFASTTADAIMTVSSVIKGLATRLYGIYTVVKDNWAWYKPMLIGVIGLYGTWRTAILAVAIAEGIVSNAMRIQRAVTAALAITMGGYKAVCDGAALAQIACYLALDKYGVIAKIATARQWLLNIALNANPIGATIAVIAAATAALVLFARTCVEAYQAWKAWQDANENARRAEDFEK